jgi:hypothetical protein
MLRWAGRVCCNQNSRETGRHLSPADSLIESLGDVEVSVLGVNDDDKVVPNVSIPPVLQPTASFYSTKRGQFDFKKLELVSLLRNGCLL